MGIKNDIPKARQNVAMTEDFLRDLMKCVNLALGGKLNCCGEVTLSNNVGITTVPYPDCGPGSVVVLQAVNAAAAAEAGTTWPTAGNGSFVIHHSISATPRILRYIVIG